MKKIIYSLMLLVGMQAFSQITITSYNPNNPNQSPELIENGDVWTTNTAEGQGAILYFYVNNAYNEDIHVRSRVESITNDDGSSFQFCFGGNCVYSIGEGSEYSGYNNYVTIPAGGTNNMWDKIQNENADGATPKDFVFKFFRVDEEGNEMDESVTFTYKYEPTASTPDMTLQKLGVQLNNTLVDNELLFATTSAMSMQIVDINGRSVATQSFEEGSNRYNTSGLTSGIYIVKFTNNQGQAAAIKIVKQ